MRTVPRRSRWPRLVRAALVLLVALACTAAAQGAQERFEDRARGLAAYRAMDYEGALAAFRRDLDRRGASMALNERAELLAYVAASQEWLGHRTDAEEGFRAALRTSARFRLDTLTFPEKVLEVFERIRSETAVLDAEAPPIATLDSAHPTMEIRLFASKPHAARIFLCDDAGRPLRLLHDGRVGERDTIRWDGRAAQGVAPVAQHLLLCATPADAPTQAARRLLEFEVTTIAAERSRSTTTVAQRSAGPRWLIGAVGALTVVVLPSLLGDGERGTPVRFVVGGALVGAAFAGSHTGVSPPLTGGPPSMRIQVRTVAPRRAEGAVDANP